MKVRFALILVMVLLGATTACPQEKGLFVSGYVFDSKNNAALSNVNIYVTGTPSGAATNQNGYFMIRIRKFPVLLYFSYVGYETKPVTVAAPSAAGIKVYLTEEVRELGEVTITGNRIMKLVRGDTLNIVDYEIAGNLVLMIANPYKQANEQRLYAAKQSGEILSSCKIPKAGRKVEDPELLAIGKTKYLFKDCYGEVQLITQDTVWQILYTNTRLYLIYPTPYKDFFELLYPVKAEIDGKIIYQDISLFQNSTYMAEQGATEPLLLKIVFDPYGDYRYVTPIFFADGLTDGSQYAVKGSYERSVAAPVIRRQSDFIIIDFFGNTMDFFNSDGECFRSVPIRFHLREYHEFIFWTRFDLDMRNFTQKVYYDSGANRIWTLWKPKPGNRLVLKEINPDTGQVVALADIPEYANVEKIHIHNNIVYFLYTEKSYPFNRSLYRMTI